MKPFTSLCPKLVFTVVLFAGGFAMAQDDVQDSQKEQEEELIGGYPIERQRLVGGPTDVATDLMLSFPMRDSILPSLFPGEWFNFKKDIYDKIGLKLSASYQSLYQNGSDDLGLLDADYAFGGWLLFEAKWNAYRKGEDYQGGTIFVQHWGIMVGLIGVFMVAAAFIESWRVPIILYGLLEKAFMVYLVATNASFPYAEGFYIPATMDSFLTVYSILYFVALRKK